MDVCANFASHLSSTCDELRSRIQNKSYTMDTYFLQTAIDCIFNDMRIDLLSVLPQSGIVDSGEEYNRVIELVDTNSVVFKLLLESDVEMFEYFTKSFCQHLERTRCNFPLEVVQDSAYMRLLSDYVCFMLPVNDQKAIDVAIKEHRTENAIKSTFSTPLNLFKEEALRRYAICPSSHSIRTLRTIAQSVSPNFLIFICIIVRSYCSLSNWPTDYRFIALRFVLREIHVFAFTQSEDLNLSQTKLQLQWNVPFTDDLFNFFLSLFNRWPSNPSFTCLFDVWVTWIRPWRYCGGDLQRVMPFIRYNRRYYVELSDAFWRRNFPLECTLDVENLISYICVLTSQDMLEVYDCLDYDLESHILALFKLMKRCADNLHLTINKSEERLKKTNWLQRTFFYSASEMISEDVMLLSEQKKTLEALKKIITNANRAVLNSTSSEVQYDLANNNEDNRFDTALCEVSSVDKGSFHSHSSFNSSSSFRKQIPDYYVDPKTKLMYLTSKGRKQVHFLRLLVRECAVLRGTHRFDYSNCFKSTPPIIAPLRSNEVWWLSKFLYQFSRALNQTKFIQNLSQCYEDSTLTGFVARFVLDPEYPRVCVPAHSTFIAFQKPCLNLRYLAFYRNLIPLCIFSMLLLFLPFCYCSIALLVMMLYSKLML
ncbi:unnamed protein product [Thelazia callipaeda]|uniref:Rab-GAP TBC domain-containing protein n=1 Tax=Thelazia callipaeda TaxID=103827 RepID=A0A0N5CVR2_THECL|nr:unnamed protein product [Thelazia callipaeda]